MILLSRIIKSGTSTLKKNDSRLIQLKQVHLDRDEEYASVNTEFNNEQQLILANAENEAKSLISQAQSQADNIINEMKEQQEAWEHEKRNLSAFAYDEGFQAGVEEGRSSGFNEYEKLIEIAKQVTDDSKIAFSEHIQSAEGTILEIAIAVAERILHTTLTEEKEKFVPLVKRAIKEARDFKDVQIHVHPIHYDLLINEKAELDAIFPNNITCFIYPDTDLEEHACFIESDNGRIDASISSQLAELKESLKDLIEGESQ